mgnify:FL=1
MFSFFKRPADDFFSTPEKEEILAAVKQAELNTSGEVRVYIEHRCRFVDPIDRAAEVFYSLKMEQTVNRNGVLVYVAVKDRQLAIFADEGIFQKAGADFWKKEVQQMLRDFNIENYALGIATTVKQIGEVLSINFPYEAGTDKNELPDDIVFGK